MYINPKNGDGVDPAVNVLAGLKQGKLKPVPLDKLIKDLVGNPGWNPKKSLRKDIQTEKIGEAYEMFNDHVIVPIVVCEHESKKGFYHLIDGHGRVAEAEDRGFDQLDARVLQPLDRLQRIVLRESLNNGQTSFDATVQLADVFLAAKEMNRDVRDADDVEEILAVFPPTLRKSARKKLKLLRDWPAAIVKQLSADAVKVGGIAYNKLEELNPLANLLKKKHGKSDEVYPQLVVLYKKDAFKGSRAQEAFRKARKIIGRLPDKHPLVDSFLAGKINLEKLAEKAEPIIKAAETAGVTIDHSALFKTIATELDSLDFDELSDREQKGLLRKLRTKIQEWGNVELSATA
jgi:hypothetical protein